MSIAGKNDPAPDRSSKLVELAVPVFLLAIALCSALALAFDFGTIAAFVIKNSVTGQGKSFTPEVFVRLRYLATVLAPLALAGAIAAFCVRTRLGSFISSHLKEIRRDSVSLFHKLKQFIWNERHWLLATLVLMAIAAMIRAPFLFTEIKHDEAANLELYASRPFFSIFSMYTLPNNHILHTLALRVAFLLFGDAPAVLRLPAFLSGLLLIPGTYVLAKALYRKRQTAFGAAALATAIPALIEYSALARGYSLQSLLTVIAFILATRMKREANWAVSYLFAIVCALGFLVIPTMLFAFMVIALWLALSLFAGDIGYDRKRFLVHTAVACLAMGILTILFYLPAVIFVGPQYIYANPFVTPQSWAAFLAELPDFFAAIFDYLNWRTVPAVGYGLLFSAVAGVVFHARLSQHRVAPLLPLAGGCLLVLFLTHRIPFLRVWVPLVPIYLIAATALFGVIKVRPAWFVAVFIAISCSLGATVIADNRSPGGQFVDSETLVGAEDLVTSLKPNLGATTRLICLFPDDVMLRFYVRRAGFDTEGWNTPAGANDQRVYVVLNKRSASPLAEQLSKALAFAPGFDRQRLFLDRPYLQVFELTREAL